MSIERPTFVVQVHTETRLAVVENLGTRERVSVTDLTQIGTHIARWLEPEPAQAGPSESSSTRTKP